MVLHCGPNRANNQRHEHSGLQALPCDVANHNQYTAILLHGRI